MVKCSELHGIAKSARGAAKIAAKATYYTFTPSLLSYFLWSGIIYVACATFAILDWYPIYDEFCTVPAEPKGCDRCSDKLLMCGKERCWQNAVNFTYHSVSAGDSLFDARHEAVQDPRCNALVEENDDPVSLLRHIDREMASGRVTPACQRWNCKVLENAFSEQSFRNSSTCRGVLCGSLSQLPQIEGICRLSPGSLTSGANERCATTTATTATRTSTTRTLSAQARSLDRAAAAARHTNAQRARDSLRDAPGRRLTNATAAQPDERDGAPNSEDWTTSEWSKCTCLQQCTEGIRTRSVTCPSGQCSQESKPPTAKACECWHCARCTVRWSILGFSAFYYFEGACCFLLWSAFLRVSYLEEEDLTHIALSMKLLGCVCKILPRLVRMCQLVSFGFILLLICQTWVDAGGDMNKACRDNRRLKVAGALIALCWLAQIVIGIFMKRRSPMPAFLFNARKPGLMRAMCRPVRAIGP